MFRNEKRLYRLLIFINILFICIVTMILIYLIPLEQCETQIIYDCNDIVLDYDYERLSFQYDQNLNLDKDLQEYLYYLCECYDIDYRVVLSFMWVESGFQSDVISSTNDYGLMQINICNHAWLKEAIGVTDLLNPYQNIQAGVYILSKLNKEYESNLDKMAMAYNLGSTGAKKLWQKGVYTTNYTKKIREKYKLLKNVKLSIDL